MSRIVIATAVFLSVTINLLIVRALVKKTAKKVHIKRTCHHRKVLIPLGQQRLTDLPGELQI